MTHIVPSTFAQFGVSKIPKVRLVWMTLYSVRKNLLIYMAAEISSPLKICYDRVAEVHYFKRGFPRDQNLTINPGPCETHRRKETSFCGLKDF